MVLMGIGMDFLAVMITFVILVGVLLGQKNAMNEYFPVMLLLNALTLLADMGTLVFSGEPSVLLKVCLILRFSFVFCGIAGFNLYVDHMISRRVGRKPLMRVVPFLLVVVMIILWITSIETGLFFQIDETGTVVYGRYFWIAELAGCLIAVFDMARIMVNQMAKKLDKGTAVGMYLFVALPLCTVAFIELLGTPTLLFAAITVSYMTMYISIHVRQEHSMLTKEADNEKMHTELIMSQIQPHFIFNSLTTIKYLCRKDAQLASAALTRFTQYLRRNLDVVSNKSMVQFKEELEHTQTYLWLEQLRFGDTLKVEYDIETDQFLVPPLSLQPIVENAVKHGVTKKIGGGTVSISTMEDEKCYTIIVRDDGLGFDEQKIIEDGEAHIGIHDIRKRISEIKGSTLTVNSRVGEGTRVVYEIMKDD